MEDELVLIYGLGRRVALEVQTNSHNLGHTFFFFNTEREITVYMDSIIDWKIIDFKINSRGLRIIYKCFHIAT